MTVLTIDKKKYILIPQKSYLALKKRAALKKNESLFTVEGARSHTKKLIRKWAKGE